MKETRLAKSQRLMCKAAHDCKRFNKLAAVVRIEMDKERIKNNLK